MTPSPFSLCRPAIQASLDAALPMLDADPAFERAALAICEQVFPTGTDSAVIADLAAQVRARVPSQQDKALLAHAHALLFEEMGLRVGAEDLGGFVVVKVLATRRGAPLVLALIYKLVLARLGFLVQGISLPGRPLVAVQVDAGSVMLVDAAAGGRVISLGEALAWSRRVSPATGPARDPVPVLGHLAWLGELAARLAERLLAQGRAADAEVLQRISAAMLAVRPAAKDAFATREKFPAEEGPGKSTPAGTDNSETDNNSEEGT